MTVTLRLIDPAVAGAIVAGRCPDGFDCAPDYPAEGDRIAAGLFLERCGAGADPRPFGAFLVCASAAGDPSRDDAVVIGGIGFHGGADERGRVEIGYGIVPSRQGAGFATQALGQLIQHAIGLGVRALTAETDHGNAVSQSVLRHHGFTEVGADERTVFLELALGWQ